MNSFFEFKYVGETVIIFIISFMLLGIILNFFIKKHYGRPDANEFDKYKYANAFDLIRIIFSIKIKDVGFVFGFLLILYRIILIIAILSAVFGIFVELFSFKVAF